MMTIYLGYLTELLVDIQLSDSFTVASCPSGVHIGTKGSL